MDKKKLMESADLSRLANITYHDILNNLLIRENGTRFGKDETISSVIGKNVLTNTLSPVGNLLNLLLNIYEKDHSIKSIKRN